MGADNGGGSGPLSLAANRNIPIIGEPVLEAWLLQVMMRCSCDAHQLVVIIGQPGSARGQCVACKKIWILAAFGVINESGEHNGEPHFHIAQGIIASTGKG